MPVFLFVLGILLTGVGLFLIGFSIPFRDFSLGNTLIISGAISIAAGLILIGIGAALRELRKIAKNLEAGVTRTRPTAASVPAARPVPAAPPPPPASPRQTVKLPPVVNTARSMRTEPRLDPHAETGVPEPPMPPAPTVADIAAERPGGLFASIRRRSLATPQAAPRVGSGVASGTGAEPAPASGRSAAPAGPMPDVGPDVGPDMDEDDNALPPPARNGHSDRPLFHPEHETSRSDAPPVARSPSLAALAARTAARLDMPRPVPDLPRAGAEQPSSESPETYERPGERSGPEAPPEKPAGNMFDSVWPTEGRASPERSVEPEPPPAEPKSPEILKSGVIDGMAYTLYADGSIEAQLPQGTLRFTSIEDLRAHLERG